MKIESKHIGRILRRVRLSQGVTQEQVADMLGVTFQQVQKYESGANRISLNRFFTLCEVMRIEANMFMGMVKVEAKTDE